MALETWLVKVKTSISKSFNSVRAPIPNTKTHITKSNVGVQAFEIAGLMSKLLHLWKVLSDKNVIRLRNESVSLEGVRKIVSNDETFLLGLACAEMAENLRLVAKSVSRIGKRCEDSNLRSFDRLLDEFANFGRDSQCWILSWRDMEVKNKKMDRYVSMTATLHREMDELSAMENSLRKALQCESDSIKEQKITDLQQKLFWQKQEVKYLKERSIWNKSFDTVTLLLVRSIFTILARIKHVFGIGHGFSYPLSLPRSLSASAVVHPYKNPNSSCSFVSGPLKNTKIGEEQKNLKIEFLELNSKFLKPPKPH